MMFGPLVLLAASISPASPATLPARKAIAGFRAASSATAHATVSIRIISGVRFGPDRAEGAETAARRKTEIRDADGLVSPLELLEFQ